MNQPQTYTSHNSLRPWLSVGLAALGVAGLFVARALVDSSGISLHENSAINANILYQSLTFVLALGVLGILYALYPQKFRHFARFGDQSTHPEPVSFLGINAKDTWRSVGTSFAVIVTIATSAFLFFNVFGGELPGLAALVVLPWALLFAVVNSFVEEALTRFTVVVGLHGTLDNRYIYILSALVFGIPHYFGTPGGVLGSIMAGFLGWLLAKSIVETRGVFWAWFIHFLQDVVIFFALFTIAAA